MNNKKLPYKVFNFIALGLPEIERKEKLRIRARENLEKKFGGLGDDGKRLLKGEKLPTQENSGGNPFNENIYFEGTRDLESSENKNIEKRKMGDEVRPETSSQDFLDKYFPLKVPIGVKRPIHSIFHLYGQDPKIMGYSRDKYHHSSLRGIVGLYHSLLELEKDSGGIGEYESEGSIRDLEEFLGRIKTYSKFKRPSTSQSRYSNISTLEKLEFAIDISRELE